MAYKNEIYVYIDGINRSSKVVLPLKWGNFLDEQLDECRLALRAVKGVEIFAPLTPVDIVLNNEMYFGVNSRRAVDKKTVVKHYLVADDSVVETQLGSGLYNHDLYLIEVTKAAECVVVDTLTFTNDLGRNYTENAGYADPIWA